MIIVILGAFAMQGFLRYKEVEVCGVNYLILDWPQVEELSFTMDDRLEAKVIQRFGFSLNDIRRDTLIVGIKRWGDLVANHLSDAFGIREVRSLGMRSYDKDFKRGPLEIYQNLDLGANPADYKLTILVDGIVDSGNTLAHALGVLREVLYPVISTSLLVKSRTNAFPDVYGDLIDGRLWVAFPWERVEITKKLVNDLRTSGHSDDECMRIIRDKFGYDRKVLKKGLLSV
ncbi:MAG TPA: hypothetical protein VJ574_05465 [Candidatus Bathyarchaeia archaeon]|nr:hypothetical protein [Candidatus Bathyarchaeia archaeon]